ncbi:MAG TPA: DUF6455 family protein [Aliidongia sp.]|nr:DUF6455 family protein [Aliidongia sp.]
MSHVERAAETPTVGSIILGVAAGLKQRATAIANVGARRTVEREIGLFAGLGQLDPVMADRGLSQSYLAALDRPMRGWAGRLHRMQRQLGVEERAELCDLVLIRDMDRVCRRCSAVQECEKWLCAGAGHAVPCFCPNRPNFERLCGD